MKNFMKSLAAFLAIAIATSWSAPALADTVTYYHNDLVGSPMASTNQAGQVVWRETYRPYGDRQRLEAASSANEIWFTSRKEDPRTELIYMGARYYDPRIGRFLQPDPVGFGEANIHSFNRYAYANNNPYRYKDPDGRASVAAFGVFVVGGIGVGLALTPQEQQQQMGRAALRAFEVAKDALLNGLLSPILSSSEESKATDQGKGSASEGKGKVKDVPDRGPPGEWIDGERRSRKYGSDGRPETDLDKPHPGAQYPHAHDWADGVREHPGRPYSPLPKKED